jgi:hypothetical protein
MNDMPRRITLSILLILSGLIGFDCRREKISAPELTGKLVVSGPCGEYIVQVLSGQIPDSSVLVKSWTNSQTDSTYSNVFAVSDVCIFGAAGLVQGDTFTFTMNGSVPTEACYTCNLVLFNAPAVRDAVTNIKKLGTN